MADQRHGEPSAAPWWEPLVFLVSLAWAGIWLWQLGIGFENDTFTCLNWGRQLAEGVELDRVNPVFTTPKILMVLLGAVGQVFPGEYGAEHFYAVVVSLAGACVATLTCRLARAFGGLLAAAIAAPLVLGHMDFVRFVVSGQSPILATAFILGSLVFITRPRDRASDYLWAGALVFGACLARPESFVLAGALALALYVRLGWRRPQWPVVILAFGVAGFAAILVFNQLLFGSWRYNYDLVMAEMSVLAKPLPSLTFGFASELARTILHYANGLPLLLFLAAVGALCLMGKEWRRWLAVLLFPCATIGIMWLLLLKGYLFNQRCLYYTLFIVIALASAGIAHLARLLAANKSLLGAMRPRLWKAAFTVVALALMAPAYASRPLPRHLSAVYRALEELAPRLRKAICQGDGAGTPVVLDESAHFMYRFRLRTHPCFREALRAVRQRLETFPEEIDYFVTYDPFLDPTTIPEQWHLRILWRDQATKVTLYARENARARSRHPRDPGAEAQETAPRHDATRHPRGDPGKGQ